MKFFLVWYSSLTSGHCLVSFHAWRKLHDTRVLDTAEKYSFRGVAILLNKLWKWFSGRNRHYWTFRKALERACSGKYLSNTLLIDRSFKQIKLWKDCPLILHIFWYWYYDELSPFHKYEANHSIFICEHACIHLSLFVQTVQGNLHLQSPLNMSKVFCHGSFKFHPVHCTTGWVSTMS